MTVQSSNDVYGVWMLGIAAASLVAIVWAVCWGKVREAVAIARIREAESRARVAEAEHGTCDCDDDPTPGES